MELIPSFSIDHTKIIPGIYESRVDVLGEELVTTFDVRIKTPNAEPAIAPAAITPDLMNSRLCIVLFPCLCCLPIRYTKHTKIPFTLSRALVYLVYFVVHTFSYIFSYLGIGSRIPPDFA